MRHTTLRTHTTTPVKKISAHIHKKQHEETATEMTLVVTTSEMTPFLGLRYCSVDGAITLKQLEIKNLNRGGNFPPEKFHLSFFLNKFKEIEKNWI